jgi:hypothetical protein
MLLLVLLVVVALLKLSRRRLRRTEEAAVPVIAESRLPHLEAEARARSLETVAG